MLQRAKVLMAVVLCVHGCAWLCVLAGIFQISTPSTSDCDVFCGVCLNSMCVRLCSSVSVRVCVRLCKCVSV